MRSTTIKLLGIFAIGAATLFTACTDVCKDVDCGTNGECVEGVCVCNTGYEGTNCESRKTTKFVGNFDVTESCTSGAYLYQCEIIESASEVLVISFDNLYDQAITVTATVDDAGTGFTIGSQTFGTGTIAGTGTINSTGSTVTVTYTVTVGGADDTCTAELARI